MSVEMFTEGNEWTDYEISVEMWNDCGDSVMNMSFK